MTTSARAPKHAMGYFLRKIRKLSQLPAAGASPRPTKQDRRCRRHPWLPLGEAVAAIGSSEPIAVTDEGCPFLRLLTQHNIGDRKAPHPSFPLCPPTGQSGKSTFPQGKALGLRKAKDTQSENGNSQPACLNMGSLSGYLTIQTGGSNPRPADPREIA